VSSGHAARTLIRLEQEADLAISPQELIMAAEDTGLINTIGDRGLLALAASKNLPQLTTLDLRHNLYDTEDGVEVKGCTPDTRRALEARFGAGVLIDGRLDA
jgi:hypothetical protein